MTISGLLSTHPLIRSGTLVRDVDVAHTAYRRYVADGLPRFRAAAARPPPATCAAKRAELGVDGLKATPIGSFVRNALIDDVYLPLIGANLAKQLGRDGRGPGRADAHLAARLRQDHARRVRGRAAGLRAGQGQRPGARARR